MAFLLHIQAGMQAIEQRLDEYARQDVAVQSYQRVPGVGLLTATALRTGAGACAHRKAEYTNATAPLPERRIHRRNYWLTEGSIYELLESWHTGLLRPLVRSAST